MSERNDAPYPTPSNDRLAALMRDYISKRRVARSTQAEARSVLKTVKQEGFSTKAFLRACEARDMDPAETKKELRDTVRIVSLVQPALVPEDLFAGWSPAVSEETRRETDIWEAGTKGYEAGRNGQKLEDCPHPVGSELHPEWVKMWRQGQAAIAREMGPDQKVASTTRRRPHQPRFEGTETRQLPAPRETVIESVRRGVKAAQAKRKRGSPRATRRAKQEHSGDGSGDTVY